MQYSSARDCSRRYEKGNKMEKYITPDFYITVYEIDDIVTLSIGIGDPDGGNGSEWWG